MLSENSYGLPRPRTVSLQSPYLDGALPSAVCDLDATIAASYAGSGTTWANLVAQPADGLSRTQYDFHLGDGSSSTYFPTFNGTAGSAAAYWTTDGGDYFRLKSLTDTLPSKWHRTSGGTPFWVAVAFRTPPGLFTATRTFWGNAGSAVNRGVASFVVSADTLSLVSANGAATALLSNMTSALSASTDYLYLLSVDPQQTSNNVRLWLNATTAVTYSMIFGESSTNSTDNFFVMANRVSTTNGATAMENGTLYYSFAMGNEFLNDTKAAALFAHLRARHGRAYA